MESNKIVGSIVISKFPYFDNITNSTKFKARPFLLIQAEHSTTPCDFTAIPVSSITLQQNVNLSYDYSLEVKKYPLSLLRKDSYARTHKLSFLNGADFSYKTLSDFRNCYPEDYTKIIGLAKEYINKI